MLKKYNEIWNKISNLLKEGFNSKRVYNDKYIKTKIRPYNETPLKNKYCNYLSIILLNSTVSVNVYKKCKHPVKQIIQIDTESDNEYDDEQNCANRTKRIYE